MLGGDCSSNLAVAFAPAPMIKGAHVIIYSKDAEADRKFFRDTLKYPYADAGHGLIRQKGPELGQALRAHFGTAEVAPRTAAAP